MCHGWHNQAYTDVFTASSEAINTLSSYGII